MFDDPASLADDMERIAKTWRACWREQLAETLAFRRLAQTFMAELAKERTAHEKTRDELRRYVSSQVGRPA